MFDLWHLHRRAVLVTGGLFVALLALLTITGVVVHFAGRRTDMTATAHTGAAPKSSAASGSKPADAPVAQASDAAQWNAMPAITPATSPSFPPVATTARTDPSAFAGAFATELFSRNYSSAQRAQVLSWAQAENAPLKSSKYPSQDWTKVLVDSLSDLTWDGATQTPVPADGVWDVLASEKATDTVSDVSVRTDPQWETTVAGGYQPSDQLATVQDVSLTVTRHVPSDGHDTTTAFDVSIAIQLGSATAGGYGAAATNNYVSKQVG